MFSHDCTVKGHRYQGRYDEHPHKGDLDFKGGVDPAALRELIVTRTYVHDICVKCGKTISRPLPTEEGR